ncbi:hypothetical protein PsAD2_04645 [Pseudovibrio axinellae]|uniref:Uncharacterized protein n=1 Tax=Pseudovibrio axinellae TaxID=989403 RepID=A0A165SWB2_9HYPH|nr:hypothetical protein PsAD2_04645 [Pseudovibrio axinellae]SEQ72982.1 hypothetical protein SAMN05421798_10463 [Pseudovibrio axinellae]
MLEYTERRPATALILEELSTTGAQLLHIWNKSNGHLSPDFIDHARKVLLMAPPATPSDSPDIIMIGNDSFARHVFGAEWAQHPTSARKAMSRTYRQLVASSYWNAYRSNRPIFDLIGANISDENYREYCRLILPVHSRAGISQLIVFTKELPDQASRTISLIN